MNRTRSISTDVFAAIWALRQDSEESEDAILRRVLKCGKASGQSDGPIRQKTNGGFHDTRNNVHFPYGFEIFRTYKRKEYRATAENGCWRRTDTSEMYDSLNQLNASITAGNENVWNGNWKYRGSDNTIKSISALRS